METQRIADLPVLIDPPADPSANMEADTQLADQIRQGIRPMTLRIYQWNQPAVTLGRRQSPDDLPSDLLEKKLAMVRRPTGGGAVVHRMDELTYALAIPRRGIPSGISLHQIPGLIHASLRGSLIDSASISSDHLSLVHADSSGPFHLCFNTPVCGDLLYRGQKVAGAALRAWREGILIQGSIQGLPVPYDQLVSAVHCAVAEGFEENG